MIDDICNAIDWVGCITNSKDHAHNIRMKAHKELNKLRAERENLRKELFNYKHHSEQRLIALREAESELREEKETVANLRAELAAVTEERDRMREALGPFDDHAIIERVAEALYVFVEAKPGNNRDFRGQAAQVLAYACPRIIAKYCAELAAVTEERDRMREALKEAQVTFDSTWSEADLLRVKNKELRREIERLREALKPFANATVIDLTHNGENFVKAIVVSEEDIKSARAILEGATK